METLDIRANSSQQGPLNPSTHLTNPSNNIPTSTLSPQKSSSSQETSPALTSHIQSNDLPSQKAKNNDEPASETDVTTMADSKLNLPSQNISQAGTIQIDGRNSPSSPIKEDEASGNIQKPVISSSTSIEEAQNFVCEKSLAENLQNNSNIPENIKISLKEEGSDESPEPVNNDKKIEENTGLKDSGKIEEDDRKQPFKKLRIETNKKTEPNENIKPEKSKFDTEGEGPNHESPNKNDQPTIPLQKESDKGSSSKDEVGQNFISDQHDSEGYNNSHVKTRDSLKDASGLSSSNEETKSKEQPPKVDQAAPKKPKISVTDFQKITLLGKGSYGEVSLVKKIPNGTKLYALKTIDKYFMKKERKEHQVYVEKEVLMKSNHPNIIKFYSSFQDKKKLYFVLEYVGGGEFSNYLRIQRKLVREQIVFFSAEIINILEYLHSNKIAHRDMKPENLLLTDDYHLKCIDFGTARFLDSDQRTSQLFPVHKDSKAEEEEDSAGDRPHRKTFVGTAQYVSPEMLANSECGAPGDLWALGCMIYQMATGYYPFEGDNEFLIFERIQNLEITYPEDMEPVVKDLIQKLLVKEPEQRLGAGPKGSENDYRALKGHQFFGGVDFSSLHKQRPPIIEIVSPYKLRNKEMNFTEAVANLSNPAAPQQKTRKHFLSDDLQTLPEEKPMARQQSQEASHPAPYELSEVVSKKCGWLFYLNRLLVLTDKPSLSYHDPDTKELKGEIPLTETTVAKLESKTNWIVNTPQKKYQFKELKADSAEKWVNAINLMAERVKQQSNATKQN